MGSLRRLQRRLSSAEGLWAGYLVLGAVAMGGYFAVPAGGAKTVVYLAIGFSGTLAVAAGARFGGAPAQAGYLLAAGLVAFATGDVVWQAYALSTGRSIPAYWAPDILYVIGYLLLGLAMVSLVHRFDPGRTVVATLDAATVASAFIMLLWEPLLRPGRATHQVTGAGKAMLLIYVGIAVMIVVLIVRVLGRRGRGNPAHLLALGGFAALLAVAIVYGFPSPQAGAALPSRVGLDIAWLTPYVLLGAAALHPSVGTFRPGKAAESRPFTMRSLIMPAAATAIVPAMLVYEFVRAKPIALGQIVFSVVLVGLITSRLAQGARSVERAYAEERAARLAAEDAQAALEESEQIFRLLAECAQDVIFRHGVDPGGRFEYVSPAILPMTGYTPEEVCSDPDILRELVHPEDIGIVATALRSVDATARAPIHRLRYLRKDGETIWVDLRLTPISDDSGKAVAIMGIVRDVTDQKQAEEALRVSEERFRLLAEHAQDVIFRHGIDVKGPFEYVSPAILPMTGYTPEELCRDPDILGKLIHPDDLGHLLAANDSASFEPMDIRWVRKDGRVISTEGRGQIVFDETGRPVAVEGIIRDVTEIRAAHAERERMLREALAARREADEASAVISEQNRMLRETDQLKDDVISVVSHDLRTPLTSIMGYLEIVLNEEVGELQSQQRRFLEVVKRNANRLVELVDNLLFISKMDAGKLQIEFEEVELERVVADAVESQKAKAELMRIHLGLAVEPLPPVMGDRVQIAEIVENLLSNAVKFTPADGSVEVRLGPAGEHAVLEVADTGVGVAAADQKHLFERFFRGKDARATLGDGLGLAIVKAIVDAHHGRVSVQSKPGEGATFRVELPFIQPAIPVAADGGAQGGKEATG